MGSRITGWGSALPEKVVTNDDLAATMDTTDEWIRERTGIHERRVGGSTAGLAVEAARAAMARAGCGPDDIDLLVLATTTPDQHLPASSATVQAELGLTCGAFDLNAACSGFVYALITADAFIGTGAMRRALVIGSDTLSRVTDWTDRGTAILFADGAGAVVVERSDEPTVLGWDLGCDGTARHILDADIGAYIHMDGREVFRRAVRAVVASAETALERAGVTAADITWFVPHQANIRIIDSAADKLGIDRSRAISVLQYTGNTSAASVPLALTAAADDGRIQPGDLLLMSGFGAGMTWASAVVRWQP
jgi:3-oxoacyl-[acyl-carrier-protein] synthase-3